MVAGSLGALGCADPCPAVPVRLPSAPVALPWVGSGYATVEGQVGDRPVAMLWDTGFPRSSIAAGEAGGLDARTTVLDFAGVRAGPMPLQLMLSGTGPSGVVGADLLHQLPLVFDARSRMTSVLPAFAAPRSEVPVGSADSGSCVGGESDRQAPALYVKGKVEGEPVTFILDTGAEASFLAMDHLALLSARPRLEGLRVESGFSGSFAASATRARSLSIGSALAANAALLGSAEVDAQLARLSELARVGWRCDAQASCSAPPRFGGFLGWNFLREFRVFLVEGGPSGPRNLGLERFASLDHVRRDLVGIGIVTSPSTEPPGLRVDTFLSVSPAREAGLAIGDVITTVDGRASETVPLPFAAPGVSVHLGVRRGASSLEVPVAVADLLPDPPAP